MSTRSKFDKLHTNDLDVDHIGNFWGDLNTRKNLKCWEDLSVKGMTTLATTHVHGNLEIEGCIISNADTIPTTAANERRHEAYQRRVKAAQDQYRIEPAEHENNGDEELYPTRIANFHKGLPHNSLGIVDPTAYQKLLNAVADPSQWDFVPLGGGVLKLVNPLGGVAFCIQGADSHRLSLPPAPTLASAQQASEACEDYWMALMRDVRFDQYNTDPLAAKAIADLNAMSDFRGPKIGGLVTSQTLFRGNAPGCLLGPFLSQFFYLDCPFGSTYISQKYRVPVTNNDYMKTWNTFLAVQNGEAPEGPMAWQPDYRHLICGRDLGGQVRMDALYQNYLQAGLTLFNLNCPFNPGSPYLNGHQNQDGFITFGPTYYLTLLGEVANRALKAVWYQKWFVHRRLRPEAFGGLVEKHKNGDMNVPIHSDFLNSQALVEMFAKNGNYLLPQTFPEGSPVHPSYGAGHATVAGACATALKAIYDAENFVISNPVQPDATGANLVPYTGGDVLTAAGEINKLAYNVSLGRNIAGVHWRTDACLELGEEIAISILRDHKKMYNENENFGGFTFKKFDGTEITV